MTRALNRALLVCVATAGFLALPTWPAFAGSYTVTACSPSNAPGLWTDTNTFPASFTTGNLCGGPAIGPLDASHQGSLYAEDILNSPATIPDGSRAGWTFTAPTGTTIAAISYYRSLAAYNDQDLVAGLFEGDSLAALEQCKIPWPFPPGSSNTCSKPNNQVPVTFTGLSANSLFVGVICRIVRAVLSCGSGGTIHAVQASMYSARVTLAENSVPLLNNVAGPLWQGVTVSGVVPVTFTASDPSGIAHQLVRSDAGATLAIASQPCDFTLAQPCPQQPSGALNVDTRRVSDGPHTFTITVIDAAGNSHAITSPPVVVKNATAALPPPPPPPPPPASTTTKIRAVITGRRLRVSGSIARSGRVKVSWRSKRRGRTLANGSRMVTIRDHKLAVTFTLTRRARAGTTRIAIRSGRRIVAHARARPS